jgi:hypothetical protein
MLKTSLLCLLAAFAFGQSVPGQREIMSGSGTITKSGVGIRYRTLLEWVGVSPDDLGRGLGGGLAVDANGIHRVVFDRRNGSYFGYDIVIGEGDTAHGHLTTFLPPSHVDHLLKQIDWGTSLRLTPLPKYPAPQVVHYGDIIELDLMASPDGKQKLTDYIEILSHQPVPPASRTTADPRDFTVDDGPVTFDARQFTIWKQGQQLKELLGFTAKPGATFWISFPGQGRCILSLTPHNGFTKSGAIRDNVMSFEIAGQEYEVRFMSPIAGTGKAWNLYMLHDLTYEPNQNAQKIVNIGTDRLENLLPKQK